MFIKVMGIRKYLKMTKTFEHFYACASNYPAKKSKAHIDIELKRSHGR